MEILCTIISPIVDRLVEPVVRQIGYVFNYSTNFHNLEEEVKLLKLKKQRVQHSVDEARRNPAKEIEADVQHWLNRGNSVIEEAEKFLFEVNERAKKRCFMGMCPNLKTRHGLSRKAVKDTEVVKLIKEEGNFIDVFRRIIPPGIGPVNGYQAFESRTLMLDEIINALKDVEVNLVGVYGMSGVGKSMLVRKLAAQVEKDGLFKKVVLASVTHKPDLKGIQQQIADWLDYKLEVESVEVRAARLHERLKREGKVLIVLDDVWEGFKLESAGIPCDDDHKGGKALESVGNIPDDKDRIKEQRGCKTLITSRNQKVLSKMGVQKEYQKQLQLLKDEEARQLFEKKVNDVKDDNLATELVTRCAGLPVLIVILATALKNKELSEWKDAFERIKRFDNEGIESRVYSPLKVSFNFLGDEEKALFLLCGQLRPQFISIRGLLKYSMGLSLFNHCATVKVARNRLLKVVNDLKRSCLFLESDNDEHVKMHDVVHSFAKSVVSQQDNALIASMDNELEEWPEKEKLERCTAISLQNCKFSILPEMFECPKLKSFFLYNDDPSLRISENFFRRMRELRLLDLSHVHLSPMPQSLLFLENLQALCLDSCIMEDISAIRKLKKLRVLSFTGSTMVRLPPEVGELTCLQVLDLSRSEQLKEVPPNVLSCLTRLEALHIGNSFVQWEGEEGDNSQKSNASLDELKLLPNLVTLDLCIMDAKLLPRDLFSKDLESFRIFIGKEWDWSNKYNSRCMLKLKLDESIQLERVKVLLMKAEYLYLDQLQGIENVLYELHGQGFPLLKHLYIQNSEIQHIIDSVFPDDAFPSLELLDLDNLNNLEKICRGPLEAEAFCSLRKLNVRSCNKLNFLFSLSIARHFVCLGEINVYSCQIMEEIVAKETGDDSGDDEVIKFAQLCSLTLEDLPKFKSFSSGLVGPLATKTTQNFYAAGSSASAKEIICVDEPEIQLSLFNGKIALPNLEDLKLYSVSVKAIWSNQLTEQSLCIQKLTSLMVHGCGDLKYIFTYSMVESLVNLKRLEICDCESLEQIITCTQRSREGETGTKIMFPKLDYLKLMDLPKLQSFCTGDLIECPLMKELRIDECDQLKTFISNVESTYAETNQDARQAYLALFDEKVAFPNMEELHIVCMHKLKIIWHDQIQPGSFYKLKVLRISHGKELLNIFPSKLLGGFQNLETLDVKKCDVLKEVFDLQELAEVQEKKFIATFELKTLDIGDLPKLEHIWNDDPQGVLSFDNLSSLRVHACPSLKSIFQASIALCLPQLEKVEISLSEVEEIVVKDKVEATRKFLFPRLKCLTLWSLQNLKCFYSGNHILECSELEKLVSYHCYRLELFVSEPQNLKKTQMEGEFEIQGQQPLFAFKKVVPNLTELSLNMKNVEMIRRKPFPADLFHKIKFLHLLCFDDPSEDFPFDLLQKFPNIEKLHIGCSRFKELLPYGVVEEKHVRVLARVRFLILDVLPLIRHVWNPNSHSGKALQDLETLEIRNCDSLVNLIPSPASLLNLTVLDVWGCQSLVNLVTLCTAKSMVNLKKMSVRNCEVVTEVLVQKDESQSQSEIIFDKLESLSLFFLSSLTCFCSASCIIKFPSLEEVFLKQCPRLKVFSQDVVIAPKLQKVYLTHDKGEWRRVTDLNTTIQLMHVDMAVYSGIQHMRFSEFPELQEMWQKQSLPLKFFKNLKTLVVDEYSFSSIAVPSNLLQSLKYLEDLEVRNCSSVEQVFGPPCSDDDVHSDHLPMLNNLHLIDLPRLIEVPKEILDFKSLKSLKIYNCSTLRYIVTPPMCVGLGQLRDMEVRNCAMVKQIIAEAVAEDGDIKLINFPLLCSITLISLHSLSNFYSGGGIVQCPSLEEIIIGDCPSAFTSALFPEPESSASDRVTAPKIRFPKLADLKLSSICVEKIWTNQLCSQQLTTLIIDGCGNLKYLFEHFMVENLALLKILKICDCKSMEEIIAARGVGEGESMLKILFPKLEFLMLRSLPKLKNFYVDVESNTEDGAKATLFDKKVALPNLEVLHISKVNWLKLIWHDEILPDSFCKLKDLMIEHAKELLNIFPMEMPKKFQNLESLVVKNCDSLQAVFGLQVAASQLRTLELEELQNLKHVHDIEDPQGLLSFHNLKSVEVWHCPNLRSLFSASIARNLERLEELHLRFCGLEDVVSKEEKLEATPKFVFPRLKLLLLWELQELKSFCTGIQALECPMLEVLVIYHCNRLQAFASEHQDLESRLDISDLQSLFSFGKVASNLETLALNRRDIAMIEQGQFPAGFFHKLTFLQLQCFYDASADFLFHLLQNFQNLKHLALRHCYFKELFPYGIVGEDTKTLSRIHKLNLRSLPFMKHIWSRDCQADQVFQNLDILEVWECNSLINLEPCPASLLNLTTLDVWSCQGLVNLVSLSTANSLVNLTSMSVRECDLVIEIVANERDECQSQSEIIFKKLESLKLLCLNSLASFSSSGCTIKFPSLEELVVTECPSMKIFSQGVIKAPKLTKVCLTEGGDKWQWERDLNTTIQQFHLPRKAQPSEEE